jgi:Cu(I)/Ag(I) efflux system membrane fusion protein
MQKLHFLIAAAVSLGLASCGESSAPPEQRRPAEQTQVGTAQPAGQQANGEVHRAQGDVTEVSGDQVTISHGPVGSAGWSAMTMTFNAPSPDMLRGVNQGDPVSFAFRQQGNAYVLSSISKAQ